MATSAEIVGYIGAAAWLPQIVAAIHKLTEKPTIAVIPEKMVEIGYTTSGPIFNLRLAVSAANKNAIIDNVAVSVQHETGDVHEFIWAGMRETFSEIKDLSGNMQFVEREYSPIALVLNRDGVIERFFRFQDPLFQSQHKQLLRGATDFEAYFKKTKKDYHQELLDSKQVHDILEFYNRYFFWKPGQYTITFSVKSPGCIVFNSSEYVFELKSYDVEDLQKNLELFRNVVDNHIRVDLEGFRPEVVKWKWASSDLERVEGVK